MRSIVEREPPAPADFRAALSDLAPPGHLSLRERRDLGAPALMS
jgi:hypothetical protein